MKPIYGGQYAPEYPNGKYQLVVSDKSWKSLKQKLKIITRKTTPCTFDERIHRIKEVQRGWLGYFRMASIQGKLKDHDVWLRNRLRYCIWSRLWQEKKPEKKRRSLIRLGVDQESRRRRESRTRMGGWAVAKSPILGTTVTLERLCKRGYVSMLSVYEKIAPHLNEPSRLRRDGVRGSPHQLTLVGQPTRLAPGVLYSSLVNHCPYSVSVSLSF
jgi:hypothetical protein